MKIESGAVERTYAPQPISRNRKDSSEKIEAEHSNLKIQRIQQQQQAQEAQTQRTEQQPDATEQDIIQAIEKANKHIRVYDRRLEFSIHELTKQIMVKVINTETEEVIREIPSEKILDMVGHLWEMAGILVDEKR